MPDFRGVRGGVEDSLDLRSESRYSVLTSTMIRITIDFREKNVAADHRSVSKSLRCSAVSYSGRRRTRN